MKVFLELFYEGNHVFYGANMTYRMQLVLQLPLHMITLIKDTHAIDNS